MADKYLVGTSKTSDRYTVGQNGKDVYMVGIKQSGGKQSGKSEDADLDNGQLDSPAGAKSLFDYKNSSDKDIKAVGDKADNQNYGGGQVMGVTNDGKFQVGGTSSMILGEKGDYGAQKDAMARRKAMLDSQKQISGNQMLSPVNQVLTNGK